MYVCVCFFSPSYTLNIFFFLLIPFVNCHFFLLVYSLFLSIFLSFFSLFFIDYANQYNSQKQKKNKNLNNKLNCQHCWNSVVFRCYYIMICNINIKLQSAALSTKRCYLRSNRNLMFINAPQTQKINEQTTKKNRFSEVFFSPKNSH